MVQQSPIQQAPVQQAPVQQGPIQQSPIQQGPVQQAQRPPRMQRGTVQLVNAENVYVRSGPGSLLVGVLNRGETFDIHNISRDGRWAWGYAGGDAARRGWVNLGEPRRGLWQQLDLQPEHNPGRPKDFSPSYLPYVRSYERAQYDIKYTRPAQVINPGATLYGNYQPERGPATPAASDFAQYDGVGLRYSPYPGWVVVFRRGGMDGVAHPQWGYMRREDVRPLPDANYDRWQREHGVTNDQMWGPGPT